MNLSDGGKNRLPMGDLGLAGLKTALTRLRLWRDGMRLDEARQVMWRTEQVVRQRSRIEQLCHENGIVVIYESKAHPIFNPTEVPTSSESHSLLTCLMKNWWRLAKKKAENLLDIRKIEQHYKGLQQEYLSRKGVDSPRFKKWFQRSRKATEYYARGGLEYLRDRDVRDLDLSTLPPATPRIPIRDFEALTKDAHELNWIVFQGKHFQHR